MAQEAVENVVRPGYLTVGTVDVSNEAGADIPMTFAVTVKSDPVSPFSLCRKCLYRMEISPLAKVVLAFLLEAEETGECRRYTYADLGLVVNRCEHSVKEIVASLRGAGLVLTMRAGERGVITFTCGPFVSWAARLLQEAGLSSGACESRVSETGVGVTVLPKSVSDSGFSVSKMAASVSKPGVRRSQPCRRKAEGPAAKKEGHVQSVPPIPPPAPAPSSKASSPAGAAATPDDDYTPRAPDIDPAHVIGMSAPYEGEFDSTVERADTLRAAGRLAGDQGDEDEFSLGSDTADTDMGQGVRINPNI